MQVLGVDIGGSAIKAAPVDLRSGQLLAERLRLETPAPLAPAEMAWKLRQIRDHFAWQGPVGVGFPAVIKRGVALTAANIHPDWLHSDVHGILAGSCAGQLAVINDADAAGLAEMRFGVGRGESGVVLLVTIGTGLGTALFSAGQLLPNTELGHLVIQGREAEALASDAARKRDQLDWSEWAGRLESVLRELERLLWPDLIILGGGGCHAHEMYLPLLKLEALVKPACLLNDAGIIGAALALVELDQMRPASTVGATSRQPA